MIQNCVRIVHTCRQITQIPHKDTDLPLCVFECKRPTKEDYFLNLEKDLQNIDIIRMFYDYLKARPIENVDLVASRQIAS